MSALRFLRTPAGRGLRIAAGLVLIAGGATTSSLWGVLGMMSGMAIVVTGIADAVFPSKRGGA